MVQLQLIIMFGIRQYDRHLGICNRICDKLLQVLSDFIPYNSVKKGSILYL